MSKSHVKADLPSYMAGDLSEARRREVDAHLAGCESCRQAASKIRSKQARLKRQALKSAKPNDGVPNLLLNRLRKEAGLNREPKHNSWLWLILLALIALAVWAVRRNWQTARAARTALAPAGDAGSLVSSTTAAQVQASSTPVLSGAQASSAAAAPAETAPAAQHWSGADSSILEPRQVIVRSSRAWRRLWSEMGQDQAAPPLNFYDTLVVGIYAGARPAGTQVLLAPAREDAEEIVIPYRLTEAAAPSVSTPAAPAGPLLHPYALMTLPRSAKDIRFQPQS